MRLRFIIPMCVVFFCMSALKVTAEAEPIFSMPAKQYEIMSLIGGGVEKQTFYGELMGDPHMYEFIATSPLSLYIELAQADLMPEPIPFSYVIVRVLLSGKVEEVGRILPRQEGWKNKTDRMLGIEFTIAETFQRDLPPGTYRIEISSPQNNGKYRLTTGTASENLGYVGTWKKIMAVHSFYDRSAFVLLSSLFIQIHLVILLFGIIVWRYRYPWSRRIITVHNV